MEMTPIQLAEFTLFDFELKCEGFTRKLKNEESMFRKVAWFSMAPHLSRNAPSIERLWPMEGDRASQSALFTKKQMHANILEFKKYRLGQAQKSQLNLN